MGDVALWLVLLFGLTSLLFVGLALPLVRRRVPPNWLYGLRVPATLADEWVWYEANARSGRDLLSLGVLLGLLAVLLPLFQVGDSAYALIWCGAAVLGSLVMAAIGWRRANRLSRERRADRASES